MIGGDPNVRRTSLDHLYDGPEDAGDGAEGRVGVMTMTEAVEMTEQLVRAVDEVNDHAPNARVKFPTAGGPEPMPSSCLKKTYASFHVCAAIFFAHAVCASAS